MNTSIISTTNLHPGWRVQLVIHRAVRRDIGRLAAALADDATPPPPEAVRAYWNVLFEQLHEHHVFEDAVVWPLMNERLGSRVDALLARNAQEHESMAAAMERFAAAVVDMTCDTTRARATLAQLHDAVHTHLAHEEADVLPLIPEAFTVEDVQRASAESAKNNPPAVFLPWLLDDAPADDVAFFTGSMPDAVRTALESTWIPGRQAIVDALGLAELAAV